MTATAQKCLLERERLGQSDLPNAECRLVDAPKNEFGCTETSFGCTETSRESDSFSGHCEHIIFTLSILQAPIISSEDLKEQAAPETRMQEGDSTNTDPERSSCDVLV